MHETLLRRGIDSTILYAPEAFSLSVPFDTKEASRLADEGYTCIVFQKVFQGGAEPLARALRARGIRTVFVTCNLFGENMVDVCDVTIAVSSFLKRTYGYRRRHKITMIEDPVEVPGDVFKTDYSAGPDVLNLVYVAGNPPNAGMVDLVVRDAPRVAMVEISGGKSTDQVDNSSVGDVAAPKQLFGRRVARTLGSTDPRDLFWKLNNLRVRRSEQKRLRENSGAGAAMPVHVDWHLDTVYQEILKRDIGVIPCDLHTEWNLAKSGNRLTMMMALGMPVVVSPLPAYLEIIKATGLSKWLVAKNSREWAAAVERLRDERLRRGIGEQGRAYARRMFNPGAVAERYLDVMVGKGMR